MKNIVRTALAASITLGLAACGDGSSSGGTPIETIPPGSTSFIVTGEAVKGTLASAQVQLFSADDLGSPLTLAEEVQTDANGMYTLTAQSEFPIAYDGAFVVKVTADEDTTMVCDASVSCGDVARGELIPASELTGLELTSIVYGNNRATTVPIANVNAISTMATNAVLASADLNDNIDLDSVSEDTLTALQIAATEVVGATIGVDLPGANIFETTIVDASVSSNVPTNDSVAATLSLINASLTNISTDTSVASSRATYTFAQAISDYFQAVDTWTAAVFADPEVNLATEYPDVTDYIARVQFDISVEVTNIEAQVVSDTGVEIVVEEVPAVVDPEDVSDSIGDIITGTGATGGSN